MILPGARSPISSPVVSPLGAVGSNRMSFLDGLPGNAVFSRSGVAWEFGPDGVLKQFASGMPRVAYDPITLAKRGVLLEYLACDNGVRNNTYVNGVLGTPGTTPDNWLLTVQSTGLSRSIVSLGKDANGIDRMGVRFFGTPSATGSVQIFMENPNGNIPAVQGEVWTASCYLRLAAGSLTNVGTTQMYIFEYDSSFVFQSSLSPTTFVLNSNPLASNLVVNSKTLAAATCANIKPMLLFNVTNGQAVDFTVEVGLAQCEKNNEPTSRVLTAGARVTRNAESCYIPAAALGYNSAASTMYMKGAIPVAGFGSSGTIMELDGGSNNDRITTYYEQGNNRIYGTCFTGGGQVTNFTNTGTMSAGNKFRVAHAMEANNANFSFNGTIATTDTTCAMPAAADKFWLGKRFGGLGHSVYVEEVAYYPRRLSNTELQALTA